MKDYPPIVLEHLENLTDHTGVIQHAIFSIPNRRTGYTTDDNARALIVALQEYDRTRDRRYLRMVTTYLSFLHYAQTPGRRFHNFMSFDQIFLDDESSEDCFGRVLWACGEALAANIHENVKKVARRLFDDAARWLPTITTLRGKAYSSIGCYFYLKGDPEAVAIRARLESLADSICAIFRANATDDWEWFEPFLTYSNGIPPRALFLAHQITGKQEYLDVALCSLDFLNKETIIDGVHHPIGCNGWFIKGEERAWFDQQPVDPMCSVMANVAAYEATSDQKYLDLARTVFDWFFGLNSLNEPLYDPVTGGCYDALTPSGPNFNQGSESTICCLLAQLTMAPYISMLSEE
ncbi:MAG: glycosyltransferase [Armatimonadetes bacterium]|nr:glycosyltransferase [Armatimonadota bacterium]